MFGVGAASTITSTAAAATAHTLLPRINATPSSSSCSLLVLISFFSTPQNTPQFHTPYLYLLLHFRFLLSCVVFQSLIGCGRVHSCSLRFSFGGSIKAMADTHTHTDALSVPHTASGNSFNPLFHFYIIYLSCFVK